MSALFLAAVLAFAPVLAGSTRVSVPMRDGVHLDTHVFTPSGQGPWPTVFTRTPYPMGVVLDHRCRKLNRHGYACVWQSVRGRNRSEGDWLPLEREVEDGLDALNWLVQQPFVDGNVAMWGESYLGAVQWAVAEQMPPEVKTLIPTVMGTEMYDLVYDGGLFRHDIISAWMSLMPASGFRLVRGARGFRTALAHRPRVTADLAATGQELPWYRAWILADRPDSAFWQRDLVKHGARAPEQTRVPVLMIAGWADAFLGPQIATWERLATRAESTLVVGPWDHIGRPASDPPLKGIRSDVGLPRNYTRAWPLILDWLDHHLKGKQATYPVGATIVWSQNGGWETAASWPPATTPLVMKFADSAGAEYCLGHLDDRSGRGTIRWTYDPADPTPSLGGAGGLAGVLPGWRGVEVGFRYQGTLCERRSDLIGFRSEPLESLLRVAGRLRVRLNVQSSAEDTAFNVRFLEELPNGRRVHVREASKVLSLRAGGDGTYTPNVPTVIELETWPVDYVFRPGSRVLVEVASASFPKVEAHPNVAGPPALAERTRRAVQTLILGGSEVAIPVVTHPMFLDEPESTP